MQWANARCQRIRWTGCMPLSPSAVEPQWGQSPCDRALHGGISRTGDLQCEEANRTGPWWFVPHSPLLGAGCFGKGKVSWQSDPPSSCRDLQRSRQLISLCPCWLFSLFTLQMPPLTGQTSWPAPSSSHSLSMAVSVALPTARHVRQSQEAPPHPWHVHHTNHLQNSNNWRRCVASEWEQEPGGWEGWWQTPQCWEGERSSFWEGAHCHPQLWLPEGP